MLKLSDTHALNKLREVLKKDLFKLSIWYLQSHGRLSVRP